MDLFPFGIVTEGFPVGGGGFAAGMGDDVEKRFAFQRIICRSPIGDILDAVFFEEFRSVFAEAAEQVVELAFESVVDAQLVNGGGGLLRCFGKCCCRDKGCDG